MFSDHDIPISLGRRSLDNESSPALLINPDQLVHGKETPLFWLCAVVSVVVYLVCLFIPTVWLLGPVLLLVGLMSHGLMLGHIKGNGIRVSHRQCPEIYQAAEEICHRIGLSEMPPIYIIESGGLLNAFATRFVMRDYVVLYSNVVEMAYEQGLEAVKFVVAHELAHIKRGHLRNRWLITPAMLLPSVGKAYYRACEYTCDAIAAYCSPEGAIGGLLALSAGKKLSQHIDPLSFAAQSHNEGGFWVWYAEIMSTHPRLPKRLQAVMSMEAVLPHTKPKTITAGTMHEMLAG